MANAYAGRIPDWDEAGVIPPMDPRDPVSFNRSPYRVSLIDVIARFGNTQVRRELLSGLLDFRAEIHRAGLTRGFQWIDGSFVEDVESSRGRAPADIDAVTFFYIPDGHTRESLALAFPNIFATTATKADFRVDSYFVGLNQTDAERIVGRAAYWYGLWGHTRRGLWKGFVEVDLDPGEDEAVRAALDRMNGEDGGLA